MGIIDNVHHSIRINCKSVDLSEARISVFDHGFLYGDSIYEAVRTIDGEILDWDAHLSRLKKSAARLSFKISWSEEELEKEIKLAIDGGSWDGDSFVRMILTRGSGPIDLDPAVCANPNLIVIAKKLPIVSQHKVDNGIDL